MSALAFIPFGVFFACCSAQSLCLRRIRSALRTRQSEMGELYDKASLFPLQGVRRFTYGRSHRALRDPEINRSVRALRALCAVAFGAWLLFALFVAAASR